MATTSSLALPLFAGGGGSDRLSQEIFSILESNFLFGAPPPEGPAGYYSSVGRVRVLSIDGGADGGALAAAALVRLERRLKELSGNPDARVADYFDLAAGSGAGGFLAAALFACRMPAEAARDVVARNRKVFSGRRGRGGGLFWRPESVFKKVFGDLTVCAAACGVGPAEVASLDGRTRLRAAAATGGGGAVSNPAAVAVTHVLHNKREFPFAAGAGDLVVLSLGGNNAAAGPRASSSSLLRIAGACQADMVDQAVSMAFGECRATNYIRIQEPGQDSEY
ncbi:hypothetical protein OsJ_22353 [Oryza sativa Japonica Group]|uniref:Patatin n=1 Tax=Oryza sativa subsp. japonica TaxID=39947 RepID=A3BEL9_ORYSJ|nr:hypothetical protein OsJ_22353 [Oryza sativa Japonica Group]